MEEDFNKVEYTGDNIKSLEWWDTTLISSIVSVAFVITFFTFSIIGTHKRHITAKEIISFIPLSDSPVVAVNTELT